MSNSINKSREGWPWVVGHMNTKFTQEVFWPKISIVTPSYNQGQYIEETILSVINQGYPNLEYIVIDGGSTDNSAEIIQKYEKHLTYWVSEKDRGQSEAINKGFRKATGEIINWLCSDDLLEPDALYNIATSFKENPDAGLVHGGVIVFDRFNDCLSIDFGSNDLSKERYMAGIVFPQPSAFFKRVLLEEIEYLNESFHFAMDYDLYSRLIQVTGFKRVDYIFSKFRHHEGSKSVKDAHKFSGEVVAAYVQCLFKNNLVDAYAKIKELNVFKKENFLENNFTNAGRIKVDEKKVLYYFLCNILINYYFTGLLTESRIILKYLLDNYDNELLLKEKGIYEIKSRLTLLPNSLILVLRKIKNNSILKYFKF